MAVDSRNQLVLQKQRRDLVILGGELFEKEWDVRYVYLSDIDFLILLYCFYAPNS